MFLGRGQRLSPSQLPEPEAGAGAGEAAGRGGSSGVTAGAQAAFVPDGHWASTVPLRDQVPKCQSHTFPRGGCGHQNKVTCVGHFRNCQRNAEECVWLYPLTGEGHVTRHQHSAEECAWPYPLTGEGM